MPTPVSTAKQCLNTEASHALDEAVSLARHRGHTQTTSLHAITAFLSLSPSQLREACIRARNAAFYPRVQLKALDFCLSVSLDRLPNSKSSAVDEPSVSNSLMAAIKRSQANQRRQPDNNFMFSLKTQNQHLGQCQDQVGCSSSSSSSSSGVKVELHYLIVSILDDPIVSRVFNDAGFRSFDVKLAILKPFQSFFRCPSSHGSRGHQGVFMCNFDGNSNSGFRPFRFPFSGNWGGLNQDEDYRRIGDVLVRKKGRNPLLVGVCANDTLRNFVEIIEKKKGLNSILPLELHGMNVISIENDLVKLVSENWNDEAIKLRFKEVDLMAEQDCLGSGLMVCFGNLTCFLGVNDDNGFAMGIMNCVVRKLTKLLEVYGSRVWLIGCATNDQTYTRFLSKFPSIDKNWDLQLVHITAIKPWMEESRFKSSLSFVPFGGFFSSPSEIKTSSNNFYQQSDNHSNEKHDQEVCFSKRGFMGSPVDKNQTTLLPSLQMADVGVNNTLEILKAGGGTILQNPTVAGFERKEDSICHSLHHTQSFLKPEKSQDSLKLATPVGFNFFEDKLKVVNNKISNNIDSHVPLKSSRHENLPEKLLGSQKSPSSGVSVVTDLGLELFPQPCKQQRKTNTIHDQVEYDQDNFKTLFKALYGKLGRQYNAVRIICQIVAHSWTSDKNYHNKSVLAGDIWLNFIGPDTFGKRKIALALAEILYGSKNNFIHVDLCSEDGILHHKSEPNYEKITSASDVRFRGKTIVDHIADELRKKPFCVVFLENVHCADPLAQRSLLHAMRNGRFLDSCGREVMISNRIFILTSKYTGNDTNFSFHKNPSYFPEEKIARARNWSLRILVKGAENYNTSNRHSSVIRTERNIPDQNFLSKRKLDVTDEKGIVEQSFDMDQFKRPNKKGLNMSLDLNYPAEVSDDDDVTENEDTDVGCNQGKSESWLEEFSDQAEKSLVKVVFETFDYDALAMKLVKSINERFFKVVGFKCLLEIEPTVMEQLLAAACSSDSDKDVEDWIEQVLSKGFAEVHKRCKLTVNSTVILATTGNVCAIEEVPKGCLPLKIMLT